MDAPVSEIMASRLFFLSQSESTLKAATLLAVHWVREPELFSSRYLCMSISRLSVEPSGFVTAASAAALPLETNVSALAKLVPGRRIICDVAPAFRMAVTAAWQLLAHSLTSRSWGSFMMPKMILFSPA